MPAWLITELFKMVLEWPKMLPRRQCTQTGNLPAKFWAQLQSNLQKHDVRDAAHGTYKTHILCKWIKIQMQPYQCAVAANAGLAADENSVHSCFNVSNSQPATSLVHSQHCLAQATDGHDSKWTKAVKTMIHTAELCKLVLEIHSFRLLSPGNGIVNGRWRSEALIGIAA